MQARAFFFCLSRALHKNTFQLEVPKIKRLSSKQLLILNRMMSYNHSSNSPPLFHTQLLSPQAQQELLLKFVQAQCLVVQQSKPLGEGIMRDQNQNRQVLLQIVEGYVLQLSLDKTQLISLFACDYQNQFQIFRKVPPAPNRLGEAEGIRFLLKENPQPISLLVKQENKIQLQRFGKILGRKFIVQLGFHTSFKAIKKIGKGMTACVYNAINYANGKEVAIKSFKRSVYFEQENCNGKISFMKEFKILTEVNHKNICQIYSVYQTQNSTYVILELYPLSLYGYLQKFGFPNIEQAKVIMINLLEGIAYLHEKGIMHRDLKLENIMVKKDEGRSGKVIPVIVDLGLAEYTSSTKYLYTRCGTPGYVAPEVLKIKSTDPVQTYTSACDIFSLGVIFHILLFKKPLFEGKEVKQVIKKNCECQIDFNSEAFLNLDQNGKDLMMRVLSKDPANRITALQALNHPFLVDQRKKIELAAENVFGTCCSILT